MLGISVHELMHMRTQPARCSQCISSIIRPSDRPKVQPTIRSVRAFRFCFGCKPTEDQPREGADDQHHPSESGGENYY